MTLELLTAKLGAAAEAAIRSGKINALVEFLSQHYVAYHSLRSDMKKGFEPSKLNEMFLARFDSEAQKLCELLPDCSVDAAVAEIVSRAKEQK